MTRATRRREGTEPHRQLPAQRSRPRFPTVAALASLAVIGIIALAAALLTRNGPPATVAAISTVDTQDVHSLAFLGSADRLLLGHHNGILESVDGGRTWTSWSTGADAMSIGIADRQPIIIAGHNVLARGERGGRWQEIVNDLPNTDIHGFARDPTDPAHMWAYLAAGGLYESRDGGAHWAETFSGHAFGLFAVVRDGQPRLIGVDPERAGIVSTDDGGRTWQLLSPPPTTPVYAMAGANGGNTIIISGSEGVFRSDDSGRTFRRLLDVGQPVLAIAVSEDGNTLVIASRDRSIYRSDDGGSTWGA